MQKTFPEQHLFTRWQRTVISAPHPLVSTVNREDLGQWQLREALAAGVRVETNRPVDRIGESQLVAGGENFTFRNLVGADGSSSLVRRQLGLVSQEVGVGLNLFVQGDFTQMEWHLDDRLFNNGYAWIFPHRDQASIGAYAGRLTVAPGTLRKNFLLWAAGHGINPGPARLRAGLINYDYRGWRFGQRFLVGDAAGLASPLTGEGIFPAIVSGEEVARTILDPHYPAPEMAQLLARHRRHRQLVNFTGSNRLACRLSMETLVAALRIGAVSFNALEMAG
jgi:geranylgeranyl reductase